MRTDLDSSRSLQHSPVEAPVPHSHASILTSAKPKTHLHCTHASLALHVSQLPCASLPLLTHPLAPHPPLTHPSLTPLAPLSPLCLPLAHLGDLSPSSHTPHSSSVMSRNR